MIDVDDPATWPPATLAWAEHHAERLAGSTEHTNDLDVRLENEAAFRATFGGEKLLAYHCTRLPAYEVGWIHRDGLRPLDQALVNDKLDGALEHGLLGATDYALLRRSHVFAIGNEDHRENKVCLLVGRKIFVAESHGLKNLLGNWGGEALRGGPGDPQVAALSELGAPTVVAAQIDAPTSGRECLSFPSLTCVFVGALLGLEDACSEIHYWRPIPASDIVAIWREGEPGFPAAPG